MADLSLYRRDDGKFDLEFDGNDLITGKSLETEVIISLGSDGRAAGNEFRNMLQDDGWWGEPTFEGDKWGSLLFTLSRRKNDSNIILLAKQYAEDSMKWLVEDGVVNSVKADATKDDVALYIDVEVSKGGESQSFRFELMWNEVA